MKCIDIKIRSYHLQYLVAWCEEIILTDWKNDTLYWSFTGRLRELLRKLSCFLDLLSAPFASVYIPEKNIADDENFSLWKGRLTFRVYISRKRERYGIKIYRLWKSSRGYLVSFINIVAVKQITLHLLISTS